MEVAVKFSDFLDGRFGQAHDRETGQAPGEMDFYGDLGGGDAPQGAAVDDGNVHVPPRRFLRRLVMVTLIIQ